MNPKTMITLVVIASQVYTSHHAVTKTMQGLIDVVEKGIERSANQDIWFSERSNNDLDENEERDRSALVNWCRLGARAKYRLYSTQRTQILARLSRRIAVLESDNRALTEECHILRAGLARREQQAGTSTPPLTPTPLSGGGSGGWAGNPTTTTNGPAGDIAELLHELRVATSRIADDEGGIDAYSASAMQGRTGGKGKGWGGPATGGTTGRRRAGDSREGAREINRFTGSSNNRRGGVGGPAGKRDRGDDPPQPFPKPPTPPPSASPVRPGRTCRPPPVSPSPSGPCWSVLWSSN